MPFPWAAVITGVASYLSAREKKKEAADAAKAKTTTEQSVPLYNSYISQLIPYILGEQHNIYQNRMRGYGLEPGAIDINALIAAGRAGMPGGTGSLARSVKPNIIDLLNEERDTPLSSTSGPRVDPTLQANEAANALAMSQPPSLEDLINYWGGEDDSVGPRDTRRA